MSAFYVNDICTYSTKNVQCYVAVTHHDIDSHTKEFAGEYETNDDDQVTDEQYIQFLGTGIPPLGMVGIQAIFGPEEYDDTFLLVPDKTLTLKFRHLNLGQLVKASPHQSLSGEVIESDLNYTIVPTDASLGTQPLFNVSHLELETARRFNVADIISYQTHIASIDSIPNEIGTVLLPNSAAVEVSYSKLHAHHNLGTLIRFRPDAFDEAKFIHGQFDPQYTSSGHLIDVRPSQIAPDWILPQEVLEFESAKDMPDMLQGEDMKEVKIVSKSKIFDVGAVVRFRDPCSAKSKYSQFSNAPKVAEKIDVNFYSIQSSVAHLTVRWQTGEVSKHLSTEIVPNIDLDEDIFLPGDIIMPKQKMSKPEDHLYRSKVGVVQSVDPDQRVAQVRWSKEERFCFTHIDGDFGVVVPIYDSILPLASDCETNEEPVYDIQAVAPLEREPGCMVFLKSSKDRNIAGTLYGYVTQTHLDGSITYCYGPDQFDQIIISPEETSLVDDYFDSTAESYDDDADDDDDDREIEGEDYDSDERSVTPFEIWAENEEGDRILMDGNAEDWMTDSDETEEENDVFADGDEMDIDASEEQVHEIMHDDIQNRNREVDHKLSEIVKSPKILPDTISKEHKFSVPNTKEEILPDLNTGTTEMSGLQSTSETYVKTRNLSNDRPALYAILDGSVPSDHRFANRNEPPTSSAFLKRIRKEHSVLMGSLPDGVYVRTWESRLDLFRVLLIGPEATPYEYAPFVVDFVLPAKFPSVPPEAHFHSWTTDGVPVNPNLYENGYICLSLLGTWDGENNTEIWRSSSTFLQVIVSILGLVLTAEPYFNEAGFHDLQGSLEHRISSAHYSEKVYFMSRDFIRHALENNVLGMEDVVRYLYTAASASSLLRLAIQNLEKAIADSQLAAPSKLVGGMKAKPTRGAVLRFQRTLKSLRECYEKMETND